MQASNDPWEDRPPRTVWTRGKGCAELAAALSGAGAVRAQGDLSASVVEARADLLVTKRVPTVALVSSATPIDFEPDGATSVVALVSGGPHSTLAAQTASRLGRSLRLRAELVSGFRVPEERDRADRVIESIGASVRGLETRTVEAWTAKQLLEEMDDDALLVIGAAGGSWIQRMFLGPGARLASSAPAGAVVVRHQPSPVFQLMSEPEYVSPLLQAADALLVSELSEIPVVAEGLLVGIVARRALESASNDTIVADLMSEAECLAPTDGADVLESARARHGDGPLPVCDDQGQLIGVIHRV